VQLQLHVLVCLTTLDRDWKGVAIFTLQLLYTREGIAFLIGQEASES
jgi:hypothetical protein